MKIFDKIKKFFSKKKDKEIENIAWGNRVKEDNQGIGLKGEGDIVSPIPEHNKEEVKGGENENNTGRDTGNSTSVDEQI